jgi:hypothetical protein
VAPVAARENTQAGPQEVVGFREPQVVVAAHGEAPDEAALGALGRGKRRKMRDLWVLGLGSAVLGAVVALGVGLMTVWQPPAVVPEPSLEGRGKSGPVTLPVRTEPRGSSQRTQATRAEPPVVRVKAEEAQVVAPPLEAGREHKQMATLRVITPGANAHIKVDGKRLHDRSPASLTLNAGAHTVVLTNTRTGKTKSLQVDLAPREVTTLRVVF